MKPILFYFFQVIIASGLLYSYYHLALKNKKFHQYNRFYLLGSVIISILIPFLDIPVYFSGERKELEDALIFFSGNMVETTVSTPIEENSPNWISIIFYSYCLFVVFAFSKMLFSFFRIWRLTETNQNEKINKIRFVNTEAPGTPFSFLNWLFWNRKIPIESSEGKQILRHEMFHIRERHSLDILFLEFVTSLLWINPFFYLIKKESTAIHEFLADQYAIHENGKWDYAELLLMHALRTRNRLVNPFFHNQIKRRIAMITTSQKTSFQYFRKMMVFPFAAIIVVLFAFSYNANHKYKQVISADHTDTIPDKLQLQHDIKATFPGGDKEWTLFIEKNLEVSTPAKKGAPAGQYDVVISFMVDKSGSIIGVAPITNHAFGMEEEVIRAIQKSPKWKPAMKDGKPVVSNYKLLFTFTVPAVNVQGKESFTELVKDKGQLLVINGVEKGVITDLNKLTEGIEPNKITTITILKDKYAIEKYGDRAKNGVIEIKTQKDITDSSQRTGSTELRLIEQQPVEKIFEKVEVPPSFPGGEIEWRKYLTRNLDASLPVKNGSPEGTFTVTVQFIVDSSGYLRDIKPLTNFGFGMEDELLRVIKKGPKWIPALQNKHRVHAYKKQSITFVVSAK